MSVTKLKLKAVDGDDVQVISAILQDALVPLVDIAFRDEEKNFVMAVQRLRREDGMDGKERICTAVNITGVASAQTHGINHNAPQQILELLAAMLDGDNLTFMFAGDAKIRLKLADWHMIVEDFGEAWPAGCSPCHDVAEVKIG